MREIVPAGIDREAYLTSSLSFTPKEANLRDYLMDFMPGTVIDAHAHSNLMEHVVSLDERIFHHMMSTFPYFSLEDSYAVKDVFFPGKKVQNLRFPHAFKGIDHRSANDYLLANSVSQDKVGVYGIPTDVAYTTQMLKHPGVAALKMYPAFFTPPVKEIYAYFKPEILEEAQSLDIPIILHLPTLITNCRDDLRNVITDFPKLRIVLAHLGLPHLVVPGLEEVYKEFASHDNLFMDTAMIPSEEVVGMAIRTFGTEKIIFGSDEPLYLVRALVYKNPKLGERLITKEKYHWVDPEEQREFSYLAKDVMHMHWSALLAVKNAVDKLPSVVRDKSRENIFYKNARSLFKFK